VIGNYTDLQSAVTEYLARDQDATLIARIPTFIQLAEAKFNRLVFHPQMEIRATATTDTTQTYPEFVLLPGDFQTMRRVRLSSVNGRPRLMFKSQVEMDEYRYSIGDTAGQPLFFTITGNELELGPTPDANYTLELIYRQLIPALANNSSNWLLTLAPDLYLYATLLESAPYIKEDERIQTWGLGFKSALDDVNSLGRNAAFNGGPLIIRPSGMTP
jgi:hypothetical protein